MFGKIVLIQFWSGGAARTHCAGAEYEVRWEQRNQALDEYMAWRILKAREELTEFENWLWKD
jgi:hypothetical protein